MLYFKVQFNRILTSESNPEERAQKEPWGWKPKASAPAGTFKGSVKSGYPQRPTVVLRRSQEKVIAAGNKIAAVRRQAESVRYSQENYSNGLFWNK